MKKTLAILLVVVQLLCLLPTTVLATETAWTEISSAEQLQAIGNSATGSYKLMANIDLSGTEWTPLKDFKGTLDGNGYTISGLTMGTSDDPMSVVTESADLRYGLFANMSNGVIKNVKLTDVAIYLSAEDVKAGIQVGALVGFVNGGTVNNCTVDGIVSVSAAGSTNGKNLAVGGLTGQVQSSATIINCVNKANVTVAGNWTTASGGSNHLKVGGIVGYLGGTAAVLNSANQGAISATNQNTVGGAAYYQVGGVIGHTGSTGAVQNCYNAGAVSGSTNAASPNGTHHVSAQIVGRMQKGTYNNFYYLSDGSNAIGKDETGTTDATVTAYTADEMKAESFVATLVTNAIALSAMEWISAANSYPVIGVYAAHAHAYTDDGNCETAVYCTICTREVIAAKTHTYTDDADTSCDNEGCEYTREVQTNGTGTEADPYLIRNAEDLATKLASGTEGKFYALAANIDLSDIEWAPLKDFKGTLDGNGYTISGLTIGTAEAPLSVVTESADLRYGLFANMSNGVIKNVKLTDVAIYLSAEDVKAGIQIGALVGFANGGTVNNCTAEGTVSVPAAGNTTGKNLAVGGLTGQVQSSATIINCINKVNVTVNGNWTTASGGSNHLKVGGIVGYLGGTAAVLNSANQGAISANNQNTVGGAAYYQVGGVIGHTASTGAVQNCYNAGSVSGSTNAASPNGTHHVSAQIVGRMQKGTYNNFYYLSDGTNAIGKDETGTTEATIIGYTADEMKGKAFAGTISESAESITGAYLWSSVNAGYPVPNAAIKGWTGSSVTLGNALDLNFYLPTSVVANTGYAMVVRTYANKAPVETKVNLSDCLTVEENSQTLYKISYKGFNAKEMGDVVQVTVYDVNGVQVSSTRTDSIKTYAVRMLGKENQPETLYTALADMLNYGAAAQLYFEYDKDNLVNSGLTVSGTTQDPACTDSRTFTENSGYVGTSFVAGCDLSMKFYVDNAIVDNIVSATATYTNHKGTQKTIDLTKGASKASGTPYVLAALAVADGRQLITVTFTMADESTIVVTDSLESYVNRQTIGDGDSTDADDAALIALMKFSDSTKAYLHRNDVG